MYKIKTHIILFIFSLFCTPVLLTALEDGEALNEETILDQYFPVEGLNQWQYSFDLKDLDEGNYNVIVQGRDAAGNLQIGEAVDFRIDPESDLPRVSITYPPRERTIRGNLNILGSADDDDGIDYVEVRLGEGEYQRALGRNYWSHTLNTESLPDGEYTLYSRSIDINGLVGHEKSVTFHLDRDSAVIETESHTNGSFVSGRINISGRATDLNGLSGMLYSLDGGLSYQPAALKGRLKDGVGSFSFSINTKEMEDGALTVLMKCEDLRGSTGRSSLLLYIDNTAPVLDIIHPREEAAEYGSFSVMGRASDELGIDSLSYTLKGEDSIEIPLTPGNPFWSFNVDYGTEKQMNLQLRVSDIAGNTASYDLKRDLNSDAAVPGLIVQENHDDEKLSVSGWIGNSSRPAGIIYSLNKGGEEILQQGRSFQLPLNSLPPGEHSLSLRAMDLQGIEGEPREVDFIVKSGDPEISLQRYLGDFDDERVFRQGGEIYLPADPKEDPLPAYRGLEGEIFFDSGNGTAGYSLPGGSVTPLKLKKGVDPGTYLFQIDFPETMEGGYYPVLIEAEDSYGGRSETLAALWVTGPEISAGSDGIFPLSPGEEGDSLRFRLENSVEFLFRGSGGTPELMDTETDSFTITESNGILTIESRASAYEPNVSIRVSQEGGRTHSYGPISLISDISPPVLELAKEGVPYYVQEQLDLTGSVLDDLALERVEYSINGEDFRILENTPLPEGSETAEGEIRASIPLSGYEDGPLYLRVRALDQAANGTVREFFLIKDSRKPEITQILPAMDEAVNGMVSLMFDLRDEWTEVFEGEFILAGSSIPLSSRDRQLALDIDLSPYETLPEDMALIIRDSAGNETVHRPGLLFDPEKDKPRLEIHTPMEQGLITSDSVFSGIVLDDDGVQRIEYRIDDNDFIPLPGGNSFEIPIALDSLSDNVHRLDVRAYDLAGVLSDTASVEFRVSLEVPQAEMISPALGTTQSGRIEITGSASDGNGIAEIQLSFDNGNSFKKADGREEWSYRVDSTVFVDGVYMMLIKAIDKYGVEEIYSGLLSIDNTAPRLDISKPLDGTMVTDELILQLRVEDELAVSEILYSLKPLDRAEAAQSPSGAELTGQLEGDEVILSSLDLNDLPAGGYNLSVFAYDEARNEVAQSRNIIIRDRSKKSVPAILFPFEGARISGPFILEGRIDGDFIPPSVTLLNDGLAMDVLDCDDRGYFSKIISPEELREGPALFQAELKLPDGTTVKGEELRMSYSPEGPWIKFDSIHTGAYVTDRPWIRGTTAYHTMTPGEEDKKEEKDRDIRTLEYSLDNGKSFKTIRPRDEWKFRLETGELNDGPLGILVRASFKNGETAVSQVHIEVDKTAPDIEILTPGDGAHLNETIRVTGTASDANGLSDVSVMLRKRSKSSHEIPSFIQGLYLDSHFLGATSYAFGIGLTFFDENVRLQALYGKAPEGRFNGDVFGLKLLANVATLPYGYLFGPDFDFLSSSLAIGSAFEYFTMTEGAVDQNGLVLGALLIQLELLKVEIDSLKYFNAYSLYMEDQIWFISSDVQGGIENRIALGLRINIF